jgi:hypothetical protein
VVILPEDVRLPEGTEVTVEAVSQPAEAVPDQLPIWTKLAELAREAEAMPCDLPEDLARNHDHYLHGQPRRS